MNDVLKQLEEQRQQLEERKATEFFEFENRQLQKLKATEEAIRELLCSVCFTKRLHTTKLIIKQ